MSARKHHPTPSHEPKPAALGTDADGHELNYDDTPASEQDRTRSVVPEESPGHFDLETKLKAEQRKDKRVRGTLRTPDALNIIVGTYISISRAEIPILRHQGRTPKIFRYWPHRRLVIDFVAGRTDEEVEKIIARRQEACEDNDYLYVPVRPAHSLVEVRDKTQPHAKVVPLREILTAAWGKDYDEHPERRGLGKSKAA